MSSIHFCDLCFLYYEYNFKAHTNPHALIIIFVKGSRNTKTEFQNNVFSQWRLRHIHSYHLSVCLI